LIFDDFYQVDTSLSRSYGGAGLGLAISKRFVQAHHGRIWAESTHGQGTTFIFTLPISHNRVVYNTELPEVKIPESMRHEVTEELKCILVIGADLSLLTTLKRHLLAYDLIDMSGKESISDAILQYFPIAIIHNVLLGERAELEEINVTSVPIIQCSLPTMGWINPNVNITASLSKPVTSQQIHDVINTLDGIETILIVDDERGFVQLVERMLNLGERAYRIYRAYDGENALHVLQDVTPNLIILDMIMPNMDGKQLIERLSQSAEWHDIPIILLSATDYTDQSLSDRNSELLIYRSDGLYVNETLNYLQATINAIQPHPHIWYKTPAKEIFHK